MPTLSRRELLQALGTAVIAPGILGASARAAESPTPAASRRNVIFFMVDQQRWDAIGRFNSVIKTPTLDRLAQQGIIFNQATCQAPMCVPSRNSLMLGLYPSQTGIRSNGSPSLSDENLPWPVLPERMRMAGYQTAGFGKTHWGKLNDVPSTRGFEVRVIGSKSLGAERGASYMEQDNPQGLAAYIKETSKYGPGEEGIAGYIGETSRIADRDHPDGWVAEQCLKFLDSGVDPKRPLFLYLSFEKPHPGLDVPKRFEDLYRIEDIPDTPQPPWTEEPESHLAYRNRTNVRSGQRSQRWHDAWEKMSREARRRTTLRYYANCSWLEHYFGLALEKLRKLGRLEDALIIFTADHGELLGERNFEFSKYCLYDSSVRVPLILSGTAIPEAKRGTVDERPTELVDLLPTIGRSVGLTLPGGLPGINLLSDERRAGSFCEFHDAGAPAYMWRNQDWKLIVYMACPQEEALTHLRQPRGELYDLREDPHEWNNLYADARHAARREQLKTELLMHLACAWSVYPVGKG